MIKYPSITNLYKRDDTSKRLNGVYAHPAYEYLKDNEWIFTEKIDGTNIRVLWNGNDVEFRGRTDNASLPGDLVTELRTLFTIEKLNEQFGFQQVCLYGEGYGPGIQKGGGLYRDNKSFILFDIMIDDYWLERSNIEGIAQNLGIDIVPIVFRGTLQEARDIIIGQPYSQAGLAFGGSSQNTQPFVCEGFVGKPAVDLFDRHGTRIIVKVKCGDFK